MGFSGEVSCVSCSAFAIKLPIFPFHTWMLKVHKEAPPAVVMIHSGVLLKWGPTGCPGSELNFFPIHPRECSDSRRSGFGQYPLRGCSRLCTVGSEEVLAFASVSHMGDHSFRYRRFE